MRLFKVVLFCLFFVCCSRSSVTGGQSSSSDLQLDSTDNPSVKPVSTFQNLAGKYQAVYRKTSFEIWIENISSLYEHREEVAQNKVNEFAVLMFEKQELEQVEAFLKKYQREHHPLFVDICENAKPEDKRYPEWLGSFILWDKLGALAFISVPADVTTELSLETIRSKYFIYFDKDDEHLLKFVNIDSAGKALSLSFLETGFVKKIWNYFLSGPMIEIKKFSDTSSGLLVKYTIVSNIADGSFEKARENNIPACSE